MFTENQLVIIFSIIFLVYGDFLRNRFLLHSFQTFSHLILVVKVHVTSRWHLNGILFSKIKSEFTEYRLANSVIYRILGIICNSKFTEYKLVIFFQFFFLSLRNLFMEQIFAQQRQRRKQAGRSALAMKLAVRRKGRHD